MGATGDAQRAQRDERSPRPFTIRRPDGRLNGLDDRWESQEVLTQAEERMADAVGAEQAFFSTCGSSLSVKTAMPAVAGPGEKMLVSRNAHKSVIAGVIVNGVHPVWVHPKFDTERHLAHPPEPTTYARRCASILTSRACC